MRTAMIMPKTRREMIQCERIKKNKNSLHYKTATKKPLNQAVLGISGHSLAQSRFFFIFYDNNQIKNVTTAKRDPEYHIDNTPSMLESESLMILATAPAENYYF